MKELIKQLLREGLDEMSTTKKSVLDYGREHNIYSSANNPNVLYKVGNPDTVTKWLEVFKTYPTLFPKIFRSGKMKDGNMFVEIEKLNTQAAKSDWAKLDQALAAAGVIDDDDAIWSVDQIFVNIVTGYMKPNDVIRALGNNQQMVKLFKDWVTFLLKANKVAVQYGYDTLDIRRKNFAYDSAGNIKAIDI